MYSLDQMIKRALDCGFTQATELKTEYLEFMPAVRDMCAADKCHAYGKSWACPPACGSLQEISEKASKYEKGLLVQTTGQMEDEFDYESIQEIEMRHEQSFLALLEDLKKDFSTMLPMGAGTCQICPQCTYPNTPCRFPDKAFPSMEAYGLFVSQICERANLPYYYGPLTMTFTACFLLV